MTAPALSPAEQAEAARFGVHDEEILRDIAEHANDVIPCVLGEHLATWRISTRCCGYDAFTCRPHLEGRREQIIRDIAVADIRCVACKHIFPRGSAYSDIIREVQL